MRIVIVGASGNVGTALLRAVAARHPDWTVVGVSRRRPPQVDPYSTATWHTLDVSAPDAADSLQTVLVGADAAVNLAWAFQPTRNERQLERTGVGGLTALLRAASATGLRHLVHMSSVGAYRAAEPGQRVDETWPTDGVPTSAYSRHKSAAERVLDDFEASDTSGMVVTRFRPGLILQHAAGSSLLRYAVPGIVPAALVKLLPVLPLDPSFVVPVVHSDDVAAAFVTELERQVGGAFNLAAEPPITRAIIAEALHAKAVHLPENVLRAAVAVSWRLHLQRLDAGWIDLAFAAPLLDCTRARRELDWQPTVSADAALREVIDGMTRADATSSPVLRHRTVLSELTDLFRRGPITERSVP